MLDFWADAEGFVFAGDGSLIIGYDTYSEQLIDIISNTAKVNSIQKQSPHIYVLAPDAAS
jgi:hypothetical protein